MTTARRIFAPGRMTQALSEFAHTFGRQLGTGLRRMRDGLRAWRVRMALTAQYRSELELLMQADDRMLADIGLTRQEVVAAAEEWRGWHGRRDALLAAATRRDDAMGGVFLVPQDIATSRGALARANASCCDGDVEFPLKAPLRARL